MWTLTFLVVLSLLLGAAAWVFFLWAARSGQYDDVEGPKYRMLEEDQEEEEAPPRGEGRRERPSM